MSEVKWDKQTDKAKLMEEVKALVKSAVEGMEERDKEDYGFVRIDAAELQRAKESAPELAAEFISTIESGTVSSVVMTDWDKLSVAGDIYGEHKWDYDLTFDFTHYPLKVTLELYRVIERLTPRALWEKAKCHEVSGEDCVKALEKEYAEWQMRWRDSRTEVGRIGWLQYILERSTGVSYLTHSYEAYRTVRLSFWSPDFSEMLWAVRNWKHLTGVK